MYCYKKILTSCYKSLSSEAWIAYDQCVVCCLISVKEGVEFLCILGVFVLFLYFAILMKAASYDHDIPPRISTCGSRGL